jgi:hypothetical protein
MRITLCRKKLGLAAAIFLMGNLGLTEAAPAAATEAKVIYLHAPNNATQTVTVWLPQKATQKTAATVPRPETQEKVIDLHAPNNPTQTTTIWIEEPTSSNSSKGTAKQ